MSNRNHACVRRAHRFEFSQTDAALAKVELGVRVLRPLLLEPRKQQTIVEPHVIERDVLFLRRELDEGQRLDYFDAATEVW